MSMQLLFVGIAAGAASALLFASIASGSLAAVILFYLSALPIMIAAIGWSHMAGLIAAIVAAGSLAAAFSGYFFLAFLAGIGLPAWWLSYLALLGRPAERPTPDGLEWYPVGHLVIWAAILGGLIIAVAVPSFGLSAESFQAELRRMLEIFLRAQNSADAPARAPSASESSRLIDVLVIMVPPFIAVLSTLINVANLWLAGRIVKISGRLKRPWPDIVAMTFPTYAPALLALAVGGTFLPGLVGILSGALTASLMLAYAMLGLTVLHIVTAGMNARGFVLGIAYAAIGLFGWPMLVATLIGLLETMFGIRANIARRRAPPGAST